MNRTSYRDWNESQHKVKCKLHTKRDRNGGIIEPSYTRRAVRYCGAVMVVGGIVMLDNPMLKKLIDTPITKIIRNHASHSHSFYVPASATVLLIRSILHVGTWVIRDGLMGWLL